MRKKLLWRMMAVVALVVGWAFTSMAPASLVGVPIDETGWAVNLDNPRGIGEVTVFFDRVDGNNIWIELVKEFNSPAFDEVNQGDALFLKFTLVDPCAPNFRPNIIIRDERVINSTGKAWRDFHIVLGVRVPAPGEPSGVQVGFDPQNIYLPGANNPFQTIRFDPAMYQGLPINEVATPLKVDMADGVFPSDGEQRVFGGGDAGHLRIVTDLPQGGVFWLKEFPTIPEPTSVVLLAFGTLVLLWQKRSARSHKSF
jgi:hypothetical protein